VALAVLDLHQAIEFSQRDLSQGTYQEDEYDIIAELGRRRSMIDSEQQEFAAMCDRWDALYYPGSMGITASGGASHWAYHSSAKLPGRSHVSLNTPPIYVDIPASLQAQPPIENIVPLIDNDESRAMAAMTERLYMAWEREIDLNFIGHRACVVKGLYGRTAAKYWWDADKGFPVVDVIDQPRHLWMGWGQSDYRQLDWVAYSHLITPETALAEYGLVCVPQKNADGEDYPYLVPYGTFATWADARIAMWTFGHIEVTDYWYLQPKNGDMPTKFGRVPHDTWNAIIVGNRVVQNEMRSEYAGRIPYIPLFNSFIPGIPNGRPELYDIEQLIREKDERITSGSQLMHNIVNSQYWQLTGPDAPEAVPVGLRPKANQVVAPGAGNRIENISPWMPEFQLEQFLTRLDREMIDVSGLNDLLRGLAPAQVMSSSKAINALVANYETRMSMKRDLYYRWRRDVWEGVRDMWAEKDDGLSAILKGSGRLDIESPSLTPRDDMETAQIARTLVDGKLWSAIRGMDKVGVDDPEAEQNIIREEQQDAALNPAAVQVQAQLAAMLQQMGMNQQQMQGQAEAQGGGEVQPQGAQLADLRASMGAAGGVPGSGETPVPGQEVQPGNTPEGQAVGAGPLGAETGGPQPQGVAQTMIKGGEATNRILMQQQLGQQPPGA